MQGESDEGDSSGKSSLARHVAVLWATYEECGWQDVLRHFIIRTRASTIENGRRLTSTEKQHIKEASHALSSMRKFSLTLTLVPVLSLGQRSDCDFENGLPV